MGVFSEAVAAHRAGDLDRAIALYPSATAEEPRAARHNLGTIASSQGRLAEAEALFRAALEARDHPETRYSLALLLLKMGRYAEAWPLHEARRELPRLSIPAGLSDRPEWRGEPLDGRRLLVIGEQGFGDQMMFARFLPPGAAYHCSPSLFRLYPEGHPAATKSTIPEADCWALVGSLPYLQGVSADLPPRPPAIATESGGGVGVMGEGISHNRDPLRRLSEADTRRLIELGRDLSPSATGARDFLETAEIVAELDLVITVDTALAHLAGSMGKPTWVLVPALSPYWPWRHVGDTSPWYPTVRIFRQQAPGDWSSVLDQIYSRT